MPDRAADIARRLAEQAEAVCRRYLSSGRREGRYWLVGDADNTPGRSMFVRLKSLEPAKPAGKWTDAATGEHGDLLDVIARRERLTTLRDTLDEARRFLVLPRAEPVDTYLNQTSAPTGSPEAARRLFAMSKPIAGTLAETYLRERGITGASNCTALRYHPRCWYRSDDEDPADHMRDSWPALIAAVTDEASFVTGAHRTWLDSSDGDAAAAVPPSANRDRVAVRGAGGDSRVLGRVRAFAPWLRRQLGCSAFAGGSAGDRHGRRQATSKPAPRLTCMSMWGGTGTQECESPAGLRGRGYSAPRNCHGGSIPGWRVLRSSRTTGRIGRRNSDRTEAPMPPPGQNQCAADLRATDLPLLGQSRGLGSGKRKPA